MKIFFALLIINLVLNSGCHEVSTSIRIKALGSPRIGAKDELKSITDDPRIHFIATNSPFVYDFVVSEGRIIGVGTGVKNSAHGLFVLNENTRSWDTQPVDSVPGPGQGVHGIILENDNFWVVGTTGFVMKKAKSDEHWRLMAKIPVPETTFIAFANSDVAYVISRAFNKKETGLRIFKTEDSGIGWKKVYENMVGGNPFDLAVLDEKTVMLAVNDEYILRTEDGGATWDQLELEPSGKKLEGSDWINMNRTGASDLEITSNVIWVVGDKGSIYVSEDKGKSWKRPANLPKSLSEQSLRSIAFSPQGKGVVVGESGYIIVSDDFGKSWTELSSDSFKETDLKRGEENLHRVRFNGEDAVILGKSGVYKLVF